MCDWEPVSMLDEKNRKARKPRRCTECRGAIAAGESYLSRRFLFDGVWSNHSVCQLCQRALSMIDNLSAKRNQTRIAKCRRATFEARMREKAGQ